MAPATATTFDLDRLTRAIESRDAETQLAAYADDAVVENVDAEHPPSNPVIVRGREAIGALLRDVASRDMQHEVSDAFVSGDRAALRVDCRYPEGARVVCLATLELRDGRIIRQRQVQSWDA
ncbi:MAG: nuclear transport factor 2 family protein [Solirubrobacteraceae bacterium]|nr:nuclear transport factor 2 family protein [Solirubrobacteraceae bacterium]